MPRRNPAPEAVPEVDDDTIPPDEQRWMEKLAKVPWIGETPPGMTEAEYFTPKPYEKTDWSDPNITGVYEHFEIPPGYPRFRVLHAARSQFKTDEHYQADRRCMESYYYSLSLSLGIAQQAATMLGLHEDCRKSACRRARRCVSRRAEDDWTVFPGPGLPPCCNTFERTATVRHWLNVKLEQHNEQVLAAQHGTEEG
jgi:hypothetical protein